MPWKYKCTNEIYLNSLVKRVICRYSLQSLQQSKNFGSQIFNSAVDSAHPQNRRQLLVCKRNQLKKTPNQTKTCQQQTNSKP